jgi:hypothetical protein
MPSWSSAVPRCTASLPATAQTPSAAEAPGSFQPAGHEGGHQGLEIATALDGGRRLKGLPEQDLTHAFRGCLGL